MLNSNASWALIGKQLRRGCALLVGMVLAPAFANADNLNYSNVFSFDLNATAAGVVEVNVGGTRYLYGTTVYTSRAYGGAIYRVSPNGGEPQTVYQLQPTDGYNPTAGLLLVTDPADNKDYLYGATINGPRTGNSISAGSGTLYRVLADGTNYQTLYTFSALDASTVTNADGAFPAYQLTTDGTYVYGVTKQGGVNGTGVVFRINLNINNPDGIGFVVLHPLSALTTDGTNTDGAFPSASLTLGPGGRLYGVTGAGGAHTWLQNSATVSSVTTQTTAGAGAIFSLNTDGSDFQTIYSFSDLNTTSSGNSRNLDGAAPRGGLLFVSGLLIGTASIGGSPADDATKIGYGTVFSLATDGTTAGTTFTTLHSFTGTDGASPTGNLLAATDGKIYGVTTGGTNSTTAPFSVYGTAYSIDSSGTTFTLEHGFTTGEVSSLTGGLIQGTDGYFYGTGTTFGGCSFYGAVFRLSPSNVANATTPTPYQNCTATGSSGGGSMGGSWLWLVAALGLAPPVRRRIFGLS